MSRPALCGARAQRAVHCTRTAWPLLERGRACASTHPHGLQRSTRLCLRVWLKENRKREGCPPPRDTRTLTRTSAPAARRRAHAHAPSVPRRCVAHAASGCGRFLRSHNTISHVGPDIAAGRADEGADEHLQDRGAEVLGVVGKPRVGTSWTPSRCVDAHSHALAVRTFPGLQRESERGEHAGGDAILAWT